MIKVALTPGSLPLLAASLAIAAALMARRRTHLARGWLLVTIGVYFTLSLPLVAHGIVDALPAPPPAALDAVASAGTIVVLDGDNRVGRVEETVRHSRINPAAPIVVLGEPWISDSLVRAGIARDRVAHVQGPPTTRLQIDWVERWAAAHQGGPILLVASRLHVPRVAALLHGRPLNVVLSPSPIDDEPVRAGARVLVPSYLALRASRDAIYEHAALRYYRSRGWIAGYVN